MRCASDCRTDHASMTWTSHHELEVVPTRCLAASGARGRRASRLGQSRVIQFGLRAEDAVALFGVSWAVPGACRRPQVAARCSERRPAAESPNLPRTRGAHGGTATAASRSYAPISVRCWCWPRSSSSCRCPRNCVADAERAVAPLLTRRLVSAVDGRYQLVPGTPPPASEAELEAVRRRAVEYFEVWAAKQ
jgi:hypothetical protein